MNVLGLNAYHGDVSASLVMDGRLVAAVEEERYRRIKHIAGFPHISAAECLRTAARRPLVAWAHADLHCDFALAGAVHGLLEPHGALKSAEAFDEHGLHLSLRLPASSFEALAERLRDLSRGSARLVRTETPDA